MSDGKLSNAELAAQAEASFNGGDYARSLDMLHRIQASLGDKQDPRLLHNIKLVESAQDGYAQSSNLRKDLQDLKDVIKARTLSKKESKIEGAAAAKPALPAAEKQSNGKGFSHSVDVEPLSIMMEADTDTSILLYNLALLHFEQQEYTASKNILEHLFRNIEPMDEIVAIHVCLLLLDVTIHTTRGNLLEDRESKSFLSQTELVLNHIEKVQSSMSKAADGGSKLSSETQFRIHISKAKIALLQNQVKGSKKEIKTALEMCKSSELKLPDMNGSSTRVEDMTSGPVVRNMTALYLKANFEYLRENYSKALKLLGSSYHDPNTLMSADGGGSSEGPAPVREGLSGAIYYNNTACVHHKMKRYNMALHFFQKALKVLEEKRDRRGVLNDGRVMPRFDSEVSYNTGLQLLLTGRPLEAFNRFEEASRLLYNRPQLWLRMAECCIQHYCQTTHEPHGVAVRAVGHGSQHRLLVNTPSSPPHDDSAAPHSGCNLRYAVQCLRNVLYLSHSLQVMAEKESARGDKLSVFGKKQSNESAPAPSLAAAAASTPPPSSPSPAAESSSQKPSIQTVAWLDLTFVHLCLSDHASALASARKLLSFGASSIHQESLCRLYAAEALCHLNRPAEALDMIAPGGRLFGSDAGSEEVKDEHSELAPSLQINHGILLAMRGDFGTAEEECRNALVSDPSNQDAVRALVYVHLRTGDTAKALQVIKSLRVPS